MTSDLGRVLVSRADAAIILRVSNRTIRNWVGDGSLVLVGGLVDLVEAEVVWQQKRAARVAGLRRTGAPGEGMMDA